MQQEKFVRIATYFYLIPLAGMFIFNTFNSLLRTTYFELYRDMETAKYKWDSPVLLLLLIIGLLILLYLLQKSKWIIKVNLRKEAICFAGIISLGFVLLFRCVATCDSALISDIAVEFSRNNYEAFEKGGYLYSYSFQLGLTALLELIYRLFGVENFVVFQLLNVVSIMVIIGMLNKITDQLFENSRISRMEAILSMGMLPLFLFATFVYGDIIGWAFGASAIYFIIKYLKEDKQKFILTASLLLMLGTLIKSNINILVVAAVIATILNCIYKRSYKAMIWCVGLIVLSQVGVQAVNAFYVHKAGLSEYPAGIPKVAWIAMSMQETDEGGYACGWYNAYNWNIYAENNYDREATMAACLNNLGESLCKFVHERRYTLDFFYKKFASQWNAPTFQAMITNEWASRGVEGLSSVAEFFIYGTGRDILYGIMNIYHFLIFLGSSVFCILQRKKWSIVKAYFMLNIFGGFLFHMIWEAQSRYILGYFVLMLPLAACGYLKIFELWESKARNWCVAKRTKIKRRN